jgi:hypothetical protein
MERVTFMRKKAGRRAAPPPLDPLAQAPTKPPQTVAEHLAQIKEMGQRVTGFIQAMGKVEKLNGVSEEVKSRAVVAFYEQLAVMETRLRNIHESLQLE